MQTKITLNGKAVSADIAPRTHLADFVREHSGLTGTHLGCEHGICGACTVEIDGEIARSCITFAVACDGATVRTIEGFDNDPLMARLRQAFTEEHALQCGYCTPGMLIAARDLIRRRAAATEAEVRVAMSGNLCRCTGYTGIVRAILRILREDLGKAAMQSVNGAGPLGPIGSFMPQSGALDPLSPPSREAIKTKRQPAPARRAVIARERVQVATEAPTELDGLTVLGQSFLLPHPAAEVWSKMRDLASVVDCLPGAKLTRLSPDGSFEGNITLSFGPITPSFEGHGKFSASDATQSGEVEGSGRELRGNSRASARMSFKLVAEGETTTRVSTQVTYKLTGPLAQFARPSFVTSIVTEIGSTFATNLNSVLSGAGGEVSTSVERTLSAWSLLRVLARSLIAGAVKRFKRTRP